MSCWFDFFRQPPRPVAQAPSTLVRQAPRTLVRRSAPEPASSGNAVTASTIVSTGAADKEDKYMLEHAEAGDAHALRLRASGDSSADVPSGDVATLMRHFP